MDKTVLEDYSALLTEMADLERRIKWTEAKIAELEVTVVADSVEGTRPDGTIGQIKIKGLPLPAYDREVLRLKRQKARYELLRAEIGVQKAEVEDFISRVPKSEIRTILRLRYLDGKTWEQVARAVRKNPDQCRMMINRFFAKKT